MERARYEFYVPGFVVVADFVGQGDAPGFWRVRCFVADSGRQVGDAEWHDSRRGAYRAARAAAVNAV